METEEELSERQRKNAQKNVKHRMNAFENRGDNALTPYQRGYYLQLREQFRTEPGRLEYREQLAAALAMLCELGMSHLRETAEKGGDIWEGGPIRRLGTYVNSLIRLLDGWPSEAGGKKNIIDVLKSGGEDEES